MKERWFTLIEMTIYISISAIIIYWIFATYEMISNFVYKSDKSVEIYTELEWLKSRISELQSETYSKFEFSTGSIFSKSNYGFEACLLINKDRTKWLVFWVFNNLNNSMQIWKIDYVWDFSPFIEEVDWPKLLNILSTNSISSIDLWWARINYNKIKITKLSCNNINKYFEFDLTLIPDYSIEYLGLKLDQWNVDNHLQIPLTIIP